MKEGQNRQIKDRFLAASITKHGGGGSSLWLLTHFIFQRSIAFTDQALQTISQTQQVCTTPPPTSLTPQLREVRGHLLETTLVEITLSDDPSFPGNGHAGTQGSGCEVQNALKDDTVSPA